MLNFVNKKGKKIIEMHDNGDLKVEEEKLKQELSLKENIIENDEQEGKE